MNKHTIPHLLFLLLPALLLISCTASSRSPSAYRDGGVSYVLAGNGMVASFDENAYPESNTVITVKATVQGHPVTAIAPSGFMGNNSIKSLSFEAGSELKTIGDEAFKGCRGLISITIPDSVTSIGKEAFFGCDPGIEVSLPKGTKELFKDSFDESAKLIERL